MTRKGPWQFGMHFRRQIILRLFTSLLHHTKRVQRQKWCYEPPSQRTKNERTKTEFNTPHYLNAGENGV